MQSDYEKAEKNRTITFPLQLYELNFLIHAYAKPAPSPPINATKVGIVLEKSKLGFTINIAPKKAMMIAKRGMGFIFSFNNIKLNRIVKKGAILFNIAASANKILSMA